MDFNTLKDSINQYTAMGVVGGAVADELARYGYTKYVVEKQTDPVKKEKLEKMTDLVGIVAPVVVGVGILYAKEGDEKLEDAAKGLMYYTAGRGAASLVKMAMVKVLTPSPVAGIGHTSSKSLGASASTVKTMNYARAILDKVSDPVSQVQISSGYRETPSFEQEFVEVLI